MVTIPASLRRLVIQRADNHRIQQLQQQIEAWQALQEELGGRE